MLQSTPTSITSPRAPAVQGQQPFGRLELQVGGSQWVGLQVASVPILCQQDPLLPSSLFFTPAGTNDKAGSPIYLLRWVSPLSIKESLAPLEDWNYPNVDPSTYIASSQP